MMFYLGFYFKQKTAYEMRISDWSSDVCSSDLDKITVDGTSLRFSDATFAGVMSSGGASFASFNGTAGNLVAVIGYANAAIIAGTAYGSEASGIRAATAAAFSKTGRASCRERVCQYV